MAEDDDRRWKPVAVPRRMAENHPAYRKHVDERYTPTDPGPHDQLHHLNVDPEVVERLYRESHPRWGWAWKVGYCVSDAWRWLWGRR